MRGHGEGTPTVRLTLLTRAGCHLCDDMKAVAAAAGRTRPLLLDEVDIAADRGLERRFATEIPVLMRGDTVLARGRTTLAALLERLRRTDSD
ncbi:MAG: glutaredoxin family protein [Acidobacteria bacterium]|nr:glutaredoxin family protein [Acidobacteriota bacterium]